MIIIAVLSYSMLLMTLLGTMHYHMMWYSKAVQAAVKEGQAELLCNDLVAHGCAQYALRKMAKTLKDGDTLLWQSPTHPEWEGTIQYVAADGNTEWDMTLALLQKSKPIKHLVMRLK